MKDKIYHWLVTRSYLSKIMYRHIYVDSHHQMWIPRWGWSKRQLKEATDKAEKLAKELNFE